MHSTANEEPIYQHTHTRPKRWTMQCHFPYMRTYVYTYICGYRTICAFHTECLQLSWQLFVAICDSALWNSVVKCKFSMSCAIQNSIVKDQSYYCDFAHYTWWSTGVHNNQALISSSIFLLVFCLKIRIFFRNWLWWSRHSTKWPPGTTQHNTWFSSDLPLPAGLCASGRWDQGVLGQWTVVRHTACLSMWVNVKFKWLYRWISKDTHHSDGVQARSN